MNINLQCEKFREQLIDNINNSNLPISSVYYIYQLILIELEKTYYASLEEIDSNNNEEEK